MKRMKVNDIRNSLIQSIREMADQPSIYVRDPKRDFTRNRKLSFEKTIFSILQMEGGTLTTELLKNFNCSTDTPSSSAFVQQREKLLPGAFESLFKKFTACTDSNHLYKGFRLLAVDGSDIQIPANEDDPASFYPSVNGNRPYSLLHLNAMYDLCRHTYVDAIVLKSRLSNEQRALTDMVDRALFASPAIVIADRGYESYNVLAHIQQKGWKFILRVKDVSSIGGIAHGLILPEKDEFDMKCHLCLCRKQTAQMKILYKDKNRYRFIPSNTHFDYLPPRCRKHDPTVTFTLSFRVVRLRISGDTFETVLTNLEESDFPPDELKQLYAMRWGIETSFRDLKYTIGLLNFHAKKVDSIFQEIYARLIMYNFSELITSHVVIDKKDRKYHYKANFSAAVHICREFLRENIPPPDVEALVSKYLVPVRPGRSRPRKATVKAAVSFLYRVA